MNMSHYFIFALTVPSGGMSVYIIMHKIASTIAQLSFSYIFFFAYKYSHVVFSRNAANIIQKLRQTKFGENFFQLFLVGIFGVIVIINLRMK